MGKDVGIFQDLDPIIGCWISGDGHYAFVDFRTTDEALQGFVLQQVQMNGQYLKVGRPKNSSGIIPLPSQLLCGDPKFNASNPQSSQQQSKTSSSAILVQQALKQSRMMESKKYAEIKYNQRLQVSNVPTNYDEKLIKELCNCFGKVVAIEMLKDKESNQFNGNINVDFDSEVDAQKAFKSMIGLSVG
mmetsp:Transcript_11014/g.18403  ORF Transcript_11014/g.18403 Transcript_11014/m.18403 type:complete len:188 (-) Transcript_11014:518-1081(-)